MLASGSLADTLSFDGYRYFDGTFGWAIDSPGLHVELPLHCLCQVFDQTPTTDLYKVSRSALVMSSCFQQYLSAKLNSKQLGTHKTRTASSSVAMAVWDSNYCSSPTMPSISTSMTVVRPVRINSFCTHSDGQTKTHLLVSLSWFRYHGKNSDFGKPTTVWYHDLFESFGIHSLIPVQFLQLRSVSLIARLDGESVLFVSMC